MRCPKCGYISFDRVERCGKCAHGLSEVAGQLNGTMAKVVTPGFLQPLLRGGRVEDGDAAAVIDLDDEVELAVIDDEEEAVAPVVDEAAEELMAQEEEEPLPMPSLDGLDVSDLVTLQEEEVVLDLGAQKPGALEQAAEAGEPAEAGPEKATAAAESRDDDLTSLNIGGAAADADEALGIAADEGVLDLSALIDVGGAPAGEESSADEGAAKTAAIDEDLSLVFGEEEEAPAPTPKPTATEELNLTLDVDEEAPLGSDEPAVKPPDIPDLGLTLESDEQQ